MVRLAALLRFARHAVGFPRTTTLAVAAFLLAAFVLAAAPSASAQMRVAVVDTQRAVMESEDGLRAQATLKKLFDKRQRELDQKQKDLQKEREELEKNRAQINTEAMAKRVENWQREMAQVQAVFVGLAQTVKDMRAAPIAACLRRCSTRSSPPTGPAANRPTPRRSLPRCSIDGVSRLGCSKTPWRTATATC